MTERTITVGGSSYKIAVEGPDGAPAAVVLAGAGDPLPDLGVLTSRLVNSGLQCFVLDTAECASTAVDHAAVVSAFDQLGLQWVNVVGIADGAVAAWETAARHFGRATSLTVLDRGHPAAADAGGAVVDTDCPAVEVATTLVLASADYREQAYASGRHALSDYRVVDLTAAAADSGPAELATALATEVILRSNPW